MFCQQAFFYMASDDQSSIRRTQSHTLLWDWKPKKANGLLLMRTKKVTNCVPTAIGGGDVSCSILISDRLDCILLDDAVGL